ncbi:MAG TPA: DUF2071 domain-containing protein [Phycisphaerae bacterium]
MVPQPLEVPTVNGHAVVGVCLIRLERIRPKGMPEWAGMSSENMAHRFAIRYEDEGQGRDGVFIPRRDTDSTLVALLGGRLFPGYHHAAKFKVRDDEDALEMDIATAGGVADVYLRARWTNQWPGSRLFADLAEASAFFRRGACGFSCARDGRTLDGVRLHTLDWSVEPLAVDDVTAAYFSDLHRFPAGSLAFDHALLMRAVPHEWHQLGDVPELAQDFAR